MRIHRITEYRVEHGGEDFTRSEEGVWCEIYDSPTDDEIYQFVSKIKALQLEDLFQKEMVRMNRQRFLGEEL